MSFRGDESSPVDQITMTRLARHFQQLGIWGVVAVHLKVWVFGICLIHYLRKMVILVRVVMDVVAVGVVMVVVFG